MSTTTNRTTATRARLVTTAMLFCGSHPLAGVARDWCLELHGRPPRGTVACGACWEHAIRTDAVFAAEEDLPPAPVADPDLIDDVAVDRACAGFPVPLTAAEVPVVVRRLRQDGRTFADIAALLGRDPDALRALARVPHRGAGVAA